MKSTYKNSCIAFATSAMLLTGFEASAQPTQLHTQTIVKADKTKTRTIILGPDGQQILPDSAKATRKKKVELATEIEVGDMERSPKALLNLLKTDKASDSDDDQDQYVSELVTLGEWKKLANEVFTKATKEASTTLYANLLSRLNIYMNSARNREVLLSLDDVIELSDISPAPLTFEDIQDLGQLTSSCIKAGALSEEFIKRLHKGTKYFGNDTPQRKRLTGQFLFFAGLTQEASKFLPTAEEAQKLKDFVIIELHIDYLSRLGRDRDDAALILKAWELNEWILAQKNTPPDMFPKLVNHSLNLIPHLKQAQRKKWLQVAVKENPQFFNILLQSFYKESAVQQRGADLGRRRQNLLTWNILQTELFSLHLDKNQDWIKTIPAFTLLWLQEANYTVKGYNKQKGMNDWQRRRQKKNFVNTEILLANIPGQGKSTHYLTNDLHARVARALIKLHCLNSDVPNALALLKDYNKRFPADSAKLAETLLINWVASVNPNVKTGQDKKLHRSKGIPLTRARQVRNLHLFAQMLKNFKAIHITNLNDKLVVDVFIACHSQAEVYRIEDIKAVFGPISEIPLARIQSLALSMHSRLSNSWHNEKLQRSYSTHRSKKQIESELSRGYRLMTEMVEEKLKTEDNWFVHILLGNFYFDWAEFERNQSTKNKQPYSEKKFKSKKDKAFTHFKKSVELYAKVTPFPAEKYYNIQPVSAWFNALMGATNIRALDKNDAIEPYYIKELRNAILSIPNPKKHMALFANYVDSNSARLAPHVKSRYLKTALSVIGDDKAGDGIRQTNKFYQELIKEVELHVTLDKDNIEIGNNQDFGIFITLRHSLELAREGGSFTKYLKDLSQQHSVDHRGNFDRNIRRALEDKFDIESITFCPPTVQQRVLDESQTGKKGWSETPLAYVHLRPTDPSNDKINSMQIDLEFRDFSGLVVLPVLSNEIIINTKEDKVATATPRDLSVVQILNENDIDQNIIKLEIKAIAKGIIPPLDELFKVEVPGFKIVKIDDEGMNVKEVESSNDDMYADCERSWVVQLKLENAKAQKPSTFSFLKPQRTGFPVVFKRYEDADLKEVKQKVSFNAEKLKSDWAWIWWIVLVLVLGLVIATVVTVKTLTGKKNNDSSQKIHYPLPAHINAFTCATFLMRIRSENAVNNLDELNADLAKLEVASFSQNVDQSIDFTAIANKWHKLANN